MRRPDPSRVHPRVLEIARARAKDRASAWSEYIRAMYQATGCLSPKCDAADFYAAYDAVSGVGKEKP